MINYNLPDDDEIYVHRSGRTGRAGKKGISMVIIHGRELRKLKNIVQYSVLASLNPSEKNSSTFMVGTPLVTFS